VKNVFPPEMLLHVGATYLKMCAAVLRI